MSSNQALLLNKLKQILTERKQLFQGKVLTLDPLQVIITSNNQIVGCTKLNNVTKNQSVVVFKDLDNKKYYCFSPEVSVTNLNSSVVTYNSFSKRRGKDLVNNYNIYFFLLDVSNSIEMASINKCLQILNNEIEHPLKIKRNDLVGIITFADTVYEYTKYINKPSKKSKVIDILNNVKNAYDGLVNKYDRYTPATFTYADFNIAEDDVDKVAKLDAYSKFWVDEGTDLPENGVDTIISVLNSITKDRVDKYLYVITDNDKYSRNENDVSLILNSKFKKLYFDIIEPINAPFEHIITQGSETNPYCTDSAVLTVLVNTEKINNYPAGSEILISNNTLIWQNGIHVIRNINNLQYRISPKRNISFTVAINIFSVVTKIFNLNNNLTAIRLSQETGVSYSHLGSFSFSIVNNSGSQKSIKIYAEFDFNNIITTDNTITTFNINNAQSIIININSLVAVTQWELVVLDDEVFYYYDISSWYNSTFDDGNWVRLGNTTLDEKTTKIINLSPITLSTTKTLFVNNSIIQSLEENDEVKVICQPQVVPLILPNSSNYFIDLPPSDKIIYL